MKKTAIKVLTLVLALALCIGMIPMSAFSVDYEKMKIKVNSISAAAGSTVDVKITLENNPGIASLKLSVQYDKSLLLKGVSYNTEMGENTMAPASLSSPVTLIWLDPFKDYCGDGLFATLTFETPIGLTDNYIADISVTFDNDDIYNIKEENVDCEVVNGSVSIFTGVAGDINGDGKLNTKDLTRMFQYLADWDVEVNKPALDTNGDGKVNNKDLTRLFQYLADWDVELCFGTVTPHIHNFIEVAAKVPTCTTSGNTEYWFCDGCGKYYSDADGETEISVESTIIEAKGHTVVVDKAVAPTDTKTGLTEGSHCSVCNEVIVAQEEIPIVAGEKYSITYNVSNGDSYLASLSINNPNPSYYTSSGLTLKNVSASGYTFLGWYDLPDGAGAEIVKKIPAGSTDDIELYAHWKKVEYTVSFDSPLVPVESKTYTVDKGVTLSNPSLAGYNFTGWCNDNNELVTSIQKGSTGNVTLHANWTSKRNQTRPINKLEEPITLEDKENGLILFTYEIGTVENIPLSQISDIYQNTNGIKQTFATVKETSVSESDAKTIANIISNSTINSSSWSLSEDWNDSVSVNENFAKQQGWEQSEAETKSRTQNDTYSLNSTSGGSKTTTTNNGISGTIHSDTSRTSAGSLSSERETGSEFEVNGKISSEYSAGVKLEGILDVGAKTSYEVGASYSNYDKNKSSSTISHSNTGTQGKSATADISSSNSGTSSWNSSSGYSASNTVGSSNTISSVLSGVINETKGYGSTYAVGGSNSSNCGIENSNTESNEYSSSVSYNKASSKTNTETIELGGENEGYYRFVLAGTAHVFAIIGYDVATKSYFVNTYSVMDDKTYTFIDYSKDTPNFNDYENGVLPFEVPIFVKNYVDCKAGYTDGLRINTSTGTIEAYTGTAKTVYIPSYMSVDNIDGNGNPGFVKVTGISENAFKNNTSIEGVSLGNFITSIPNNAFYGCSSLKEILAPGVTSIGANAFSGCTSLAGFTVPAEICSLGTGAFTGVNNVTINASTIDVAKNAVSCGAKNFIINIASVSSELNGITLTIPETAEYCEIQGGNRTFTNLVIKSDAKSTYLNGITFNNSNGTPLKISSENVTLNGVSISSNGFGIILTSDSVISLRQNNSISSNSGRALLCKDIAFENADSAVSGYLNIVGDAYVCKNISTNNLVTFESGKAIIITETEYDKYFNGVYTLTLNANGGSVSSSSKTVCYGEIIDSLPTPTRTGFDFDGWYTLSNGGTKIATGTVASFTNDATLYAHWTAKSYKINWNTGSGYVITVKRTSSPNAGTATGTLSNGATIYFGDILTVTYSANPGYTIASSGTKSITVNRNVTSTDIYATVTVNKYTASWSTGTGYSITVKRTSSQNAGATIGTLSSGATVYYGDVLTVTYTKADYYAISTHGKTSITVSGNVTSSDIYATATLNSVSGWVSESSVPSGAKITETKYTYSHRYYTQSTASSMSGWTKYNQTTNTSYGSWSAWGTSSISASSSVDVQSKTVYRYYFYKCQKCGYRMPYKNTACKSCGTTVGDNWNCIWSDVKYSSSSYYNYDSAKCYTTSVGDGGRYYFSKGNANATAVGTKDSTSSAVVITTGYRSRSISYSTTYYYYQDRSEESTTKPSGSDYSNINTMVKYRAK